MNRNQGPGPEIKCGERWESSQGVTLHGMCVRVWVDLWVDGICHGEPMENYGVTMLNGSPPVRDPTNAKLNYILETPFLKGQDKSIL